MNTPEGFRPVANVIWNLFLAFLPVILANITLWVSRLKIGRLSRRFLIAVCLIIWAVLLPNTCYLFTEWRHYLDAVTETQMYDRALVSHSAMAHLLGLTLFYACYSGAGLLAFFLAIWPLDKRLRVRHPTSAFIARFIGFPLCSLGVYLGLIHRFNSWDLIHKHLMHTIIEISAQALSSRFSSAIILAFAVFLGVLYWGFDIWMDGFRFREASRRGNSRKS